MSRRLRAVLMSAAIMNGSPGFHKLAFRVDAGRGRIENVTVLVSTDAERKLVSQLTRARLPRPEGARLLQAWARWEMSLRFRETGLIPATITITATDLDDFGAYATNLGQSLLAS